MPRKRLTTQGNAPTKAPSKKARQRSPAKVAQASQQPTQAPPQHDPQSTLQAQPLQVPQSALQAQQVPQVPQLLQAPQPELQAQPVLQAPHLLQATQPMLQTKPVPQPTVQQTSKKIGEEGACSGVEFPPSYLFKRKDDDIMPGLTEHLEKMRAGDGGISNLFLYKDDETLPVLTENIKGSGAVSSSPDGKSVPYLIKNPYSDILMRGKKLNEAGAFSEEEFDSKGIRPSGKSHSEYENFEDIFLDPFFTTMKEESLRDNDLPKFSKGAESREKIKESADLDNPKEDLLQHMQTEETIVRHARGLVVGCAGAGKTTLLYSLMGKSVEEIKEIRSTRGLQVYEHIFTVTDGSLLATENLERKFLVRVPRSLLAKKNGNYNEDADRIEEDNTGDLSDQKEKDNTGNNCKLHDTNDICEENTENIGPEENSINLTSDVKVEDHSTTALDTKAKDTVAETLSPEIIKKILDAQENEISVSMIDFAGQFAYYACHQIYMRSSAFYILVMDMSKRFEEIVIDEEEDQKGSVFSTWKYKDYVEFWLNSIQSFGGPEAPILIVATHTKGKTEDATHTDGKTEDENKIEKDIDEYFARLWRYLPKEDAKWLSEHHRKKDRFAFELIKIQEEERTQKLQSLKRSLVDVVSNKLDTKISVRSSWAFLEHLLRDSGKPIISYEEIQEMNKGVPEQYRLDSEEEIHKFLTFFHEHGILLYFDDEATRTHAILGLQWFSDAFSRLIADPKHVHEDCRQHLIKKWDRFNQTGKLQGALVEALWKEKEKDVPNAQSIKADKKELLSYMERLRIKYKTELMSYMERLRMLVSISGIEKSGCWYVPCMNKKPFKKDIIKAYKACSSILCFRFTSFAVFMFYRLIAYCMSSAKNALNWEVVPDTTDKCLFQTAAVFEFKNHKVLLGICDTDIQLQVLKLSDIEIEVSCEVGRLINEGLKELTKTFKNTDFKRGYKCQKTFCDEKNKSFIKVEDLCQSKGEVIDCRWCPIENPHEINVPEIRRYWEQNLKEKESVSTVSQFPLDRTEGRESKTGEELRKRDDDSYPFEHTEILGKYEMGKLIGRIQFKGGRSVGTGFKVGRKYVMTAYHVMRNNLNLLWREVHKMLTEEERKMIKWTNEVPVTGYWNISKFISSLDPNKKDKLEKLEKDVIGQYEIRFEFLKEPEGRIAKFKHNIAFASPEHDVLVLELAEQEGSDPKSFSLLVNDFCEEKLHVFGHPNGNPLQHDPACTIIKDEKQLSALRAEGINYFQKELHTKIHEIEKDYASCVISDDKVLFHSSKSTAHGASGAPLIIVDKDTPKVYGMLLMGHPKTFYNSFTYIDKNHLRLLVESGISMKKVKSLLESSLPELEQELFDSTLSLGMSGQRC